MSQITITPAQATKASLAIRAMYDGKEDPAIESLLADLAEVIASRPQESTCHTCGTVIPINPQGRTKLYCSNACMQKAYRKRRKAWKRVVLGTRPAKAK